MIRLFSLGNLAFIPESKTVRVEQQEWAEFVQHENMESSREIKFDLKMNSFRSINKVLIRANEKQQKGGLLIGYYESIEQRNKRIVKKCKHVNPVVRLHFDFIIRRVIPKLFPFGLLDKTTTLNRNRSLSDCEMLGRLGYCGYCILKFSKDDRFTYYRAEKVNKPSTTVEKFGYLIRVPRVGKNGKIIKIFKFRTMYPFAKYLQAYLIEKNGFAKNGKINNDFRILGWSRIIRKLWLDEVPQLLNLLRGDIKLFGVRPISMDMYNRYPKDLQIDRIKSKPGLIPPFYVDLPKSFDEIVESERRYLELYQQHPFKTDKRYLFMAARNIIFKGARSN
jgi:lipopolysaccharide/colanic/teichoic acid biosynthesis glycosyltransferase